MTPDEFKSARNDLGLTQGALAKKLGVSCRAVQSWEATGAGARAVPGIFIRVMRLARAEPGLLDRLAATI